MQRKHPIVLARLAFLTSLAVGVVLAAANADAQAGPSGPGRGRILFLRCASCHEISDRASLKIGPNLKGVAGRKAGALPGYAYSPALKAAAFTWTPVMLDRWLTKPDAVVPGTIMAFEGMPSEADRKALIAYLASPTP